MILYEAMLREGLDAEGQERLDEALEMGGADAPVDPEKRARQMTLMGGEVTIG